MKAGFPSEHTLSWLVAGGSLAVILTALAFEHMFGILPCPLCLGQRTAYYLTIPLAILLALTINHIPRPLAIGLFLACAALMIWTATLGAYHSGVEWGLWSGPQSCTSAQITPALTGNILDTIQTIKVPRCDQAAFRFLGLSLAGWNTLAAASIATIALIGAFSARRGKAPL